MPDFDITSKGGHKRPGVSKIGRPEKGVKARANEHEKKLAEKLPGARRQPASGALEQHKGDIQLENFLLDSKETVGSSMMIMGADLTKISREAFGESRKPGLVITIPQVPSTVEKEWVLIPISVFAHMVEQGQDKGV